jgi:hypothetical protein
VSCPLLCFVLQVRKTGEPYVTHCIETALIVESNLPHWRHDSRCVTGGVHSPRLPRAASAAMHNVILFSICYRLPRELSTRSLQTDHAGCGVLQCSCCLCWTVF